MEVDNFQEFALMVLAGILLSVLVYGYQVSVKPSLEKAGLVDSGCGCGGH